MFNYVICGKVSQYCWIRVLGTDNFLSDWANWACRKSDRSLFIAWVTWVHRLKPHKFLTWFPYFSLLFFFLIVFSATHPECAESLLRKWPDTFLPLRLRYNCRGGSSQQLKISFYNLHWTCSNLRYIFFTISIGLAQLSSALNDL